MCRSLCNQRYGPVGTRMRDTPTHYKLITTLFIKFHDRWLLRQRALHAPRRYVHYLFTRVYNPSNGDRRNRPPIRLHPSSPLHHRATDAPSSRATLNAVPPLSRSLLIVFHLAFENHRIARAYEISEVACRSACSS